MTPKDNTVQSPQRKPSDARREGPTAAAIEVWLVTHIAELLEIDPQEVDVRQPFTYYGLSSADGVILAGDLEDWLGRSLPATLAWDYPTIESVALYLAGEAAAESLPATALNQGAGYEEMEQLLTDLEGLSENEARSMLDSQRQPSQREDRHE